MILSECENLDSAIAYANTASKTRNQQLGVWSNDIHWAGPNPEYTCFVGDADVLTYCMLMYVTLPTVLNAVD